MKKFIVDWECGSVGGDKKRKISWYLVSTFKVTAKIYLALQVLNVKFTFRWIIPFTGELWLVTDTLKLRM